MSIYEDPKKDKFLHNLYYNEHRQVGRDSLWWYIRNTLHRTDISRRYVWNWLIKQESHQLFIKRKPTTNIRPIITNRVCSILQIDLIDFSNRPSQGNFRYILNIIDVFSRKVWLRPLKYKTIQNVIKELDPVILEIQKKHKINVIQSDRGVEFNIHFPNISHVQSPAYTPQSQGMVERSNQSIKRILFKILYNEKSKNWITYLPEIENIYNTTPKQELKGKSPDELYDSSTEIQQEIHEHQKNIKAKAFKNITTILTIGTKVRMAIPIDHPSQKTKGNPKWSTDVYLINKVYRGNDVSTIPRYQLTLNGKIVKNQYPLSKLLVIP